MFVYGTYDASKGRELVGPKIKYIVGKSVTSPKFKGFFRLIYASDDGNIKVVRPYLPTEHLHGKLTQLLKFNEHTSILRLELTVILKSLKVIDDETIKELSSELLSRHLAVDKCRKSAGSCNVESEQDVLLENAKLVRRLTIAIIKALRDRKVAASLMERIDVNRKHYLQLKYFEKSNRYYLPKLRMTTAQTSDNFELSTKEGITRQVTSRELLEKYSSRIVGFDIYVSGMRVNDQSKILIVPSNNLL